MAEERVEHAFPKRFGHLFGAHALCQAASEAKMNWGWLHELLEGLPGVGPILGNVTATEIDGIAHFRKLGTGTTDEVYQRNPS